MNTTIACSLFEVPPHHFTISKNKCRGESVTIEEGCYGEKL